MRGLFDKSILKAGSSDGEDCGALLIIIIVIGIIYAVVTAVGHLFTMFFASAPPWVLVFLIVSFIFLIYALWAFVKTPKYKGGKRT